MFTSILHGQWILGLKFITMIVHDDPEETFKLYAGFNLRADRHVARPFQRNSIRFNANSKKTFSHSRFLSSNEHPFVP